MKHKAMKFKPKTAARQCPCDHLLVQADFGASGVWARGGCVTDLSWLGVTPELATRFKKWISHYETVLDDNDKPFDWIGFSRRGRELAVGLKRELPEVRVEYYDESKNQDRPEGVPAVWEEISHDTVT